MPGTDGIFHSNCSWDEDDDEHAVDEMRLLPLVIWLLKGEEVAVEGEAMKRCVIRAF